jgi:predicted dehydrogenase
MIKVGICGFGGLGRVHAGNLYQMDDVQIVAVCDERSEQLTAQNIQLNLDAGQKPFDLRACRVYQDCRHMLRQEQLDAVVMALPTDLHAKYAVMALKAGCHVFGEKPMALTVKECDRMVAAARAAGRQLMIGQCLRFWPEYNALRAAVRGGEHGRLLALTMDRIGGYSSWTAGGWMNDARRSGGAILDLHLHDLDWCLFALGKPAAIYAAGCYGRSGGVDDLTAVWEYAAGAAVTMRGSWLYRGFTMNFRAHFERAVLEYGFPPNPALRLMRHDAQEWENVSVEAANPYVNEIRYFLDCVAGKQANTLCAPESTRDSVRLVKLEEKAIRKHKRFEVGA